MRNEMEIGNENPTQKEGSVPITSRPHCQKCAKGPENEVITTQSANKLYDKRLSYDQEMLSRFW